MAKWTFFGRVLPERIPVTWMTPITASATVDALGIAFDYKLTVTDSQAMVDIAITRGHADTATMRNLAKDCIRTVTDLVGYKYGVSFDIDVISAVCQETGEWEVFGIGVPVLSNRRKPEDCGPLDGKLVEAVHRDVPAQIALADFREAMGVPVGTGFFCYRAIEALMQSMRANPKEDTNSLSWPRFRETLCVDRSAIDHVKQHADAPRHGIPSSITDADRAKVLVITDEIIRRYLEYIIRGRAELQEREFPVFA
jgi:hypothetical protein